MIKIRIVTIVIDLASVLHRSPNDHVESTILGANGLGNVLFYDLGHSIPIYRM